MSNSESKAIKKKQELNSSLGKKRLPKLKCTRISTQKILT